MTGGLLIFPTVSGALLGPSSGSVTALQVAREAEVIGGRGLCNVTLAPDSAMTAAELCPGTMQTHSLRTAMCTVLGTCPSRREAGCIGLVALQEGPWIPHGIPVAKDGHGSLGRGFMPKP